MRNMFDSNFWKLLQSFINFFKNWFNRQWRSLLLLFIGVYLPLQVFVLLAVKILEIEGGLPWDIPILMAIHTTARTQLDVFASILTKLGVSWGVFPVVTVLSSRLLLQRRWRALIYIFITLMGSTLINRTAKGLLHRVRPHLWNSSFPPEPEFAFPSGHAMSSMTLVAVLVVLSWRSRWRWLTLAFGSVFVVAIAWTRLYLGVHFPSDIVAGWMVSVAWAIAVSLVVRPHLTVAISENNQSSDEAPSSPQSLIGE